MQVSTPVYTYYPPVNGGVPQVQAVIAPPPPEVPEAKEFGKAVWVKEIRTTSHNNREVKLRDLVSDDPDDADDKNWKNGEPDEVEVEWQILQKDTRKADGGPNNEVPAAAEDLPGGDEVVTRRYEFFKYTGPVDNESGEAMGSKVGPDGIHGVGIKIINGVEVDLSTVEVVGEFAGSQMAAVDVDAPVGLIDHVSEAGVGEPFAARSVVVPGAFPFICMREGVLPTGMSFDEVTGILSGTPEESGEFNFRITADASRQLVAHFAPFVTINASGMPAKGGVVSGSGGYANGSIASLMAEANLGYAFNGWTENSADVNAPADYVFTVNGARTLVAKFIAVPRVVVVTGAPGSHMMDITWPAAALGWVLEESPDLIDWTPSALPVTTTGDTNKVSVNTSAPGRYFRLSHP